MARKGPWGSGSSARVVRARGLTVIKPRISRTTKIWQIYRRSTGQAPKREACASFAQPLHNFGKPDGFECCQACIFALRGGFPRHQKAHERISA